MKKDSKKVKFFFPLEHKSDVWMKTNFPTSFGHPKAIKIPENTFLLSASFLPQHKPARSKKSFGICFVTSLKAWSLKLTAYWLSRKVIVALGLDGCVEQLARRMSPGSYFVNSVQRVGGEWGNSVNDNEAKKTRWRKMNYTFCPPPSHTQICSMWG